MHTHTYTHTHTYNYKLSIILISISPHTFFNYVSESYCVLSVMYLVCKSDLFFPTSSATTKIFSIYHKLLPDNLSFILFPFFPTCFSSLMYKPHGSTELA